MRTHTVSSAKSSPIVRPSKLKDNEGWATKIEIAKIARSQAIRTRKGKPATFADHVVGSTGQ